MIKITGDAPEIKRVQTGWFSFDHALADQTDIGYPLGQIAEIYGPNGCLADESFIRYEIRDRNGRRQNEKGGTIERLFERFHKIPRKGQGYYQRKQTEQSLFFVTSIDEQDRLVTNLICDVVYTGEKECYKITTKNNKFSLLCTNDHKFYVGNNNYVPLFDLSVGDIVFVNNRTYKKSSNQRSKYKEVTVKYHPKGSKKVVNGYEYFRLRKSNLVYEADMNHIEYDEYIHLLNTVSKERIDRLIFVPESFDIHHINHNTLDDSLENLKGMTRAEHNKEHYNTMKYNAARIAIPDTIESIEFVGVRKTYDIKCLSPHNNYVANNIIVHNCGKSTFVHSLSCILARETNSNIVLADFEGLNVKLLTANAELQKFDGEFYRIQDVKDETVLQELLKSMGDKKKHYAVGIVDAVGSISPVSEAEGDLGDANMGRRALLMGQFSRRVNHILINNHDKSMLLINHQHPRIGMGFGMTTPGGETKKYSASIRIQISRMRLKNKEETFPDGSYIIKGSVVKNRWGLEDRDFYAFVLAGKGVHIGLTNMYDGIILGLVSRERSIKIGDTNFGYLKDLIAHAQAGDDEYFKPFHDVLTDKVEFIKEDIEEEDE